MTVDFRKHCKIIATEFFGCFAVMFCAVGIAITTGSTTTTSVQTDSQVKTVAVGFATIVAVIVAATGAHLNPAITAGLACTGFSSRLHASLVPAYMFGQFTGTLAGVGFLAALLPASLTGNFAANAISPEISALRGVFLEFSCTAILLASIVSCLFKPSNTALIPVIKPIVVGLSVFILHVFLIPLTGCSLNPARSLSTAVAARKFLNLWIFFVGPLAGGVVGGLFGRCMVHFDVVNHWT
jgi:aquaporin rerated protein, invertebrate